MATNTTRVRLSLRNIALIRLDQIILEHRLVYGARALFGGCTITTWTFTTNMPAVRTKEDKREYTLSHRSSSSVVSLSCTIRTRTRGATSITAFQDILPFPNGIPTEPIHHALLSFCTLRMSHLDLGTVDNLTCWLFFSCKRSKKNVWSLELAQLPGRHKFSDMIPRGLRRPLQKFYADLGGIPYNQWRRKMDPVLEKAIVASKGIKTTTGKDFRDTLGSEGFRQ
jgi:hypothetical protein